MKRTRSGRSEGGMVQRRVGCAAAVGCVALLVAALSGGVAGAQQGATMSGLPRHSEVLSSIHMLDTQAGWAVTAQGDVVRTGDGGVHWKLVTPSYPASAGRRRVVADFFDASSAWVAVSGTDPDGTATALVFRTTDGGQTWQATTVQRGGPVDQTWQATTTQQGSPIYRITFFDAQHGWLLAKRVDRASAEAVDILRTTDGGKTWVVVSRALAASTDAPPPGRLPFGGDKSGLGFRDATTGWTTGSFPAPGPVFLYVTHDGGATWHRQDVPVHPDQAAAQVATTPPRFFTVSEGILPVSFATGSAASLDVYVTHDGGASWAGTTPVPALAATATFIDARHGWATDGRLLYGTSDGGEHWTTLVPGGRFQHITRLDFVSSQVGWALRAAASRAPSLLQTTDGGHTWGPIL